jgi:hypothetical protein
MLSLSELRFFSFEGPSPTTHESSFENDGQQRKMTYLLASGWEEEVP